MVIAAAAAIRLLRLEPIEIGGDALNKWFFVRQWFHHFDITQVAWTHHEARMGVNLPLALFQAIFGHRAIVYHVVAVTVSTAVAAVVYAAGRLIHGRSVGVLAALWVLLFPSWDRAGSQVEPESFGALYIGIALCCLLVYERTPKRKLVWLAGSAVSVAGAYLAKGSMVFFLPGALLAVFLLGRRWLHVAGYGLVFLTIVGIETAFYRLVSSHSSRLSIVSQSHGSGQSPIESVWDFFTRYESLPGYWFPLLSLALLGALSLPWLTRDRRILSAICLPASFFFFYTFAVRGLDPPRFWTRFLERYLDVAVPYAALVALCFISVTFSKLKPYRPELFKSILSFTPWAPGLTFALLLSVTLLVYVDKPPNARHPLLSTPALERILTDAYRRGIPIVGRGDGGTKALRAAYKAYILDDVLLRDGKLVKINVKRGRLVRPLARRLPRRCRIQVSRRKRFLRVKPMKVLGARCG